ncbi:MAG: lipocalin family protein [Pseudomonadota bacterium]
MWKSILLAAVVPICTAQAGVRDVSASMMPLAGFEANRLLGHWFEVASTANFLEQDCHATTAEVALRDDSRLTLKIACHKISVSGPILPLEGVMVQTDPATFEVRLVKLSELGNLHLVVLWQAEDDTVAAIGSPEGQIGWIWSKSAHPQAAALEQAKAALVKAGYQGRAIKPVEQAP